MEHKQCRGGGGERWRRRNWKDQRFEVELETRYRRCEGDEWGAKQGGDEGLYGYFGEQKARGRGGGHDRREGDYGEEAEPADAQETANLFVEEGGGGDER